MPTGARIAVTLAFRTGFLAGRTFEFDAPRRLVLGRSQDADLTIFDEKVSRRHCSLAVEGDAVVVRDLGSTCGTFVNGARITQTVLRDGDVLALAETQALVEIGQTSETDRFISGNTAVLASSPPEGTPIGPGAAFGAYRVVRRLGEGMSGPVFEAQDGLGRPVALKVLSLGAATDDDRARFEREASLLAKLVHPNVVRVVSHGQIGGWCFIAMELVRGKTLLEWLQKQGRVPVPVAVHVTRQIASALELARTFDVVHRDVKPENVIIQPDGVAKLTDFGLAKLVETSPTYQVTQDGDVVGTLAYMSPEQLASSTTADHRSDVYSLGATLYHLLASRAPYEASTHAEFAKKILDERPVPLAKLRPDVPPIVVKLVERCMDKDRERRMQTAGEVERLCGQLLSPTIGNDTAV